MVTSAFGACRYQNLAIYVVITLLLLLLLLFEFFLVISETPPYLLLLTKTLHLLDTFRLLTVCAKTAISLGDPLLP